MTTLKSGLAFFSSNSVSAMVPMTQDDVHRTVVGPLEKLTMQTEKAAQIRQDSSNKEGFDTLQKCTEAVAVALYGPSADVSQAPEKEQDNGFSYKR